MLIDIIILEKILNYLSSADENKRIKGKNLSRILSKLQSSFPKHSLIFIYSSCTLSITSYK